MPESYLFLLVQNNKASKPARGTHIIIKAVSCGYEPPPGLRSTLRVEVSFLHGF